MVLLKVILRKLQLFKVKVHHMGADYADLGERLSFQHPQRMLSLKLVYQEAAMFSTSLLYLLQSTLSALNTCLLLLLDRGLCRAA